MTVVERVDAFQRRHPRAGFPIAVLYKYLDDSGGNQAALLAYYGLLSLFPLLLLATTLLGVVLAGHPHLQQQVLGSALRQFPVVGPQLAHPKALSGGPVRVVIGLLGALYGGLGISLALQNVMNAAWMVPRNSRRNPLRARLRGLELLGLVGVVAVAGAVLSAVGGGAGPFGAALRVLALVLSLTVNAAGFIAVFRLAAARPLTVAQVAPGAVTAAVAWQLLQSVGSAYVNHTIKGASASDGVFALVLGLMAFFYLASVVLVLCVEANVVRVERLYPRALLTPVTDEVDLTTGDELAYGGQARAQRSKGFEDIDVSFGKTGLRGRR